MSHRSIKPRVLSGLAAMAAVILTVGVAACSSSGSSTASSTSSSRSSAMGTKTLVVESTPLSPLTQTFNPFSATSTGYTLHSTNLYYEPLFFFNILSPSQAPVPMLATAYSFSNGGKTLTLTTRSGVKWSDGKPFSAADVAFTFNLIAKNPALAQTGTPAPTSATATGPNTVVLNFATPQAGNLYLIGTQAIVSQHIWQSVSNPATYADANPVGTGPYVLDKFTPQGILFKANPNYWNKSEIHVPEVDFPSYVSNTAAEQALESGQIDWAGNYLTNVQNVFVAKDPAHNKVWFSSSPYMTANNVVTLWLNTARAPLNDPKVRQALSYATNRQQLADQGETGYELPATSSSGLLLPVDQSLLQSQYANDLPATGDAAKVASILTSDGYTKTGGKWAKDGKTISFSIEDPISFSDFWLDVQLLTAQLVHRPGHRQLRRDDPLVQQRSHPVLLLLQLDGQQHQRAARQDRGEQLRPVRRPAGRVRPHAVCEQHQPVHPAGGAERAARHRVQPDAGDPAAVRRVLGRVQHQELHRLAEPGQPVHRPGTQPDGDRVRDPAPQARVLRLTERG
jgi:peptide/nickel transport system substrate-binding protein